MPDAEVKEFSQNHRITGSAPPEPHRKADSDAALASDPVSDPQRLANEQQWLLLAHDETWPGRSDALQYYPDLSPLAAR